MDTQGHGIFFFFMTLICSLSFTYNVNAPPPPHPLHASSVVQKNFVFVHILHHLTDFSFYLMASLSLEVNKAILLSAAP